MNERTSAIIMLIERVLKILDLTLKLNVLARNNHGLQELNNELFYVKTDNEVLEKYLEAMPEFAWEQPNIGFYCYEHVKFELVDGEHQPVLQIVFSKRGIDQHKTREGLRTVHNKLGFKQRPKWEKTFNAYGDTPTTKYEYKETFEVSKAQMEELLDCELPSTIKKFEILINGMFKLEGIRSTKCKVVEETHKTIVCNLQG